MSGIGISWAICKSAPRSRQITTPAFHHSVFTLLFTIYLLIDVEVLSSAVNFFVYVAFLRRFRRRLVAAACFRGGVATGSRDADSVGHMTTELGREASRESSGVGCGSDQPKGRVNTAEFSVVPVVVALSLAASDQNGVQANHWVMCVIPIQNSCTWVRSFYGSGQNCRA